MLWYKFLIWYWFKWGVSSWNYGQSIVLLVFFCGDSWSNDHPTGSQEALGRHQVVARQPKVFNNQVRMEIVATSISQSRPARPGYMYSTLQDTVFHPGFIPFFPKVLLSNWMQGYPSYPPRHLHWKSHWPWPHKVRDAQLSQFSRIPLTSKITGWCQLKYVLFSPRKLGKMNPFWRGWNHQV